jgi:hypothetical protein
MAQRLLDRPPARWTIAVALPIAMILLDPAVFHSRVFGVGMPILGRFKPFCYTATLIAVVSAAAWLWRPRASALGSGLLAGGALFAAALGCAILPFSALGVLFLGVGLLGFTPFLMARVYARCAKDAFSGTTGFRWAAFALGVAVVLGVPLVVQAEASRALQQSLSDLASADPTTNGRGIERLGRWSPVLDYEQLIGAYVKEADPNRQARIAAAYRELTGVHAANRAVELMD